MSNSMILVFTENQPLADELATQFDEVLRITGAEHPEQLLQSPKLILVDTELTAFREGEGLIQAFHAQWPSAPIVILAKTSDRQQILAGLGSGACDFVYTDGLPDLMHSRIQLRLDTQEKKESANKVYLTDNIWLDVPKRRLENSEGKTQQLSPIEVAMTQCFLDAGDQVVSRDEIKRACWEDTNVTDNALNRKLHELRRSLGAMSPDIAIRTIYGAGFVMEILESSYKASA